MKRKNIISFTAAIVCMFSLASCGSVKTVPDGDGKPIVTNNSSEASTEEQSSSSESQEASTTSTSDEQSDTSTTTSTVTTNDKTYIANGNTGSSNKDDENNNSNGDNSNGDNENSQNSSKKITLSYYEAEIAVGETKMYPLVSETITEVWTSSDTSVATVDTAGNITGTGEGNCIITVANAHDASQKAQVKVTVKKSSSDMTFMGGILIVNKSYSLPRSYNPGGLTAETSAAFYQLSQDAAAANLNIYLSSGFRSYEYQEQIYNNNVYYYGQAATDTFSARPGHSEHQTGMAIDVNTIDDSFAGTPEAIWLEEHCYDYGFIIRYPKGKQWITGYKYEPWHIRYIGKENALKFKNAAAAVGDRYYTLEEYFGIDSYYH